MTNVHRKLTWKATVGLSIGWCLVTFSLQTWILYGLTGFERTAVRAGTVEDRLAMAQHHVGEAMSHSQSLIDPNPPTTEGRVQWPDLVNMMRDTSWVSRTQGNRWVIDTNRLTTLLKEQTYREGVTREQAWAAQSNVLHALTEVNEAKRAKAMADGFSFRLWTSWVIVTGVPIVGVVCWQAMLKRRTGEGGDEREDRLDHETAQMT